MHTNSTTLIPQIELDLIEAYLNGGWDYDFYDYFTDNQIPSDTRVGQLSIAVARVLLNPIQDSLPQWAAVTDSGKVLLNRKEIKRHPQATKLTLDPRLVCGINWAISGSRNSWPESYHITFIPGFDKYIVTASRDGTDVHGSADHALGWGTVTEGELPTAKRLIQEFWRDMLCEWEQERWDTLLKKGVIDENTAAAWAEEVWNPPNDEEASYEIIKKYD